MCVLCVCVCVCVRAKSGCGFLRIPKDTTDSNTTVSAADENLCCERVFSRSRVEAFGGQCEHLKFGLVDLSSTPLSAFGSLLQSGLSVCAGARLPSTELVALVSPCPSLSVVPAVTACAAAYSSAPSTTGRGSATAGPSRCGSATPA